MELSKDATLFTETQELNKIQISVCPRILINPRIYPTIRVLRNHLIKMQFDVPMMIEEKSYLGIHKAAQLVNLSKIKEWEIVKGQSLYITHLENEGSNFILKIRLK